MGPLWKISELQQRLGAAEFRPPRKNICEIAAAVRAKHPLGELKLDADVELHNDCSDIDKEIAATGTPTRTSPKPMPTEMKKLQDISPTPLVHRPFRTDFGPNSRAVLSRRAAVPVGWKRSRGNGSGQFSGVPGRSNAPSPSGLPDRHRGICC